MRLLLLEDDARLRHAIGGCLRGDGYAVDDVGTLGEAAWNLGDASYDGLVFDRLVPDGDSLDLLASIADGDLPACLLLSGLGCAEERVRGLEHGATDYMAKPVRLDELLLRVRRMVVRRTAASPAPIQVGPSVVVDQIRHVVTVDGSPVHLTGHQYAVVAYLVSNLDRVVLTEELLDHCWDRNRELFANPLHTQITRLRKLFAGHLCFTSVRGVGYRLDPVEPS